tara:strand:+ start:20633 stop:20797 length:165 start_codon:yes stop_codon:yes gene_type:complete
MTSPLPQNPIQAAAADKGQSGISVPESEKGISIQPPFIGINFIMATQGIYPSRY